MAPSKEFNQTVFPGQSRVEAIDDSLLNTIGNHGLVKRIAGK